MANNALWYKTLMPKKLIDIVREDIDDATKDLKEAKVFSGVQHSIRDSRVDWKLPLITGLLDFVIIMFFGQIEIIFYTIFLDLIRSLCNIPHTMRENITIGM